MGFFGSMFGENGGEANSIAGRAYSYNNVCWSCHAAISNLSNSRCPSCGWYICSRCGACSKGCDISGERIDEFRKQRLKQIEREAELIRIENERKAELQREEDRKNSAVIITSLEEFVIAMFMFFEFRKMKIGDFFFAISNVQLSEFKEIYSSLKSESEERYLKWLHKYYDNKFVDGLNISNMWKSVCNGTRIDLYDYLGYISMQDVDYTISGRTIRLVEVEGIDRRRKLLRLKIVIQDKKLIYQKLMKLFEDFVFDRDYDARENMYVGEVNFRKDYSDYPHHCRYYSGNGEFIEETDDGLLAATARLTDFKIDKDIHFYCACDKAQYPSVKGMVYFSVGMYKVVCIKPMFFDDDVIYGNWVSRYTAQEARVHIMNQWCEKNATILDSFRLVAKDEKRWQHCIKLRSEKDCIPLDRKSIEDDEEYALSDVGLYLKESEDGSILCAATQICKKKFINKYGYAFEGEKDFQTFSKAANKYIERCKKKKKFPNKEFMEYVFGVKGKTPDWKWR